MARRRPVEIHGMGKDLLFALAGGLDAAGELAAAAGPGHADLFACPARRHLFTDSSLRSCDLDTTALGLQRSREFSTG